MKNNDLLNISISPHTPTEHKDLQIKSIDDAISLAKKGLDIELKPLVNDDIPYCWGAIDGVNFGFLVSHSAGVEYRIRPMLEINGTLCSNEQEAQEVLKVLHDQQQRAVYDYFTK